MVIVLPLTVKVKGTSVASKILSKLIFAAVAVLASMFVEKVATITGSTGTVVAAVAPFKSISPATRLTRVSGVGSSSFLHEVKKAEKIAKPRTRLNKKNLCYIMLKFRLLRINSEHKKIDLIIILY
jgi:hypothetical protein